MFFPLSDDRPSRNWDLIAARKYCVDLLTSHSQATALLVTALLYHHNIFWQNKQEYRLMTAAVLCDWLNWHLWPVTKDCRLNATQPLILTPQIYSRQMESSLVLMRTQAWLHYSGHSDETWYGVVNLNVLQMCISACRSWKKISEKQQLWTVLEMWLPLKRFEPWGSHDWTEAQPESDAAVSYGH